MGHLPPQLDYRTKPQLTEFDYEPMGWPARIGLIAFAIAIGLHIIFVLLPDVLLPG